MSLPFYNGVQQDDPAKSLVVDYALVLDPDEESGFGLGS